MDVCICTCVCECAHVRIYVYVGHQWANMGHQADVATKLSTVVANVCGSRVWEVLHPFGA